jgi:hypothetical protein
MAISETDIENKAKDPASVSTDEGTVSERSVDEMIAADKYSNSKQAVAGGLPRGLMINRIKPGSTISS